MEDTHKTLHLTVELDMANNKPQVADIKMEDEEGNKKTYRQKVLSYLKEQVESCEIEVAHYDTMIPELLSNSEYKMEAIKARERLRMVRNYYKVLELL
jgi:hypothetical protein